MSRGIELLLLIGLVLGTVFVWRQPSRAGQIDQLDIIDISRDYAASERRRASAAPSMNRHVVRGRSRRRRSGSSLA